VSFDLEQTKHRHLGFDKNQRHLFFWIPNLTLQVRKMNRVFVLGIAHKHGGKQNNFKQ
jgi:hypothetical protein